MAIDVSAVPPEEIRPWRDLYRREMNCQIVLDSWHARRWTDAYSLQVEGRMVGYGQVGGVRAHLKDTITEFYILPIYRTPALPLFRRLIEVSGARTIEAQSNDLLLTLMLYDCAQRITSDTILFQDGYTTNLISNGGLFRRVEPADHERYFVGQKPDDIDGWMIETDGVVAASGGVLFHYNVPFGDIYMGVAEPHRRRGYGSYLVQELKRVCYEMGRVPAARCNATNTASRSTLQKAGMLPCARVLVGTLEPLAILF